jgi:hypothetical protein
VDELGSGAKPPEITEEQRQAARGAVLYQTVSRLEKLYQRVEERVQEDADGVRPLDPRFLELGVRILKDQALLYGLGKPAPVQEEEDEDPSIQGVDRKALILEQLTVLEAKQRERHSPSEEPRPDLSDGVFDADIIGDATAPSPGTSG